MGTHPSGPAMLATNPAISLQDWLEQHSQALGATVLKRFGLKLPFLFKVGQKQAPVVRPEVYFTHAADLMYRQQNILYMQVLSVETALSIQSHPDKELAERLHAEQPHVSSP